MCNCVILKLPCFFSSNLFVITLRKNKGRGERRKERKRRLSRLKKVTLLVLLMEISTPSFNFNLQVLNTASIKWINIIFFSDAKESPFVVYILRMVLWMGEGGGGGGVANIHYPSAKFNPLDIDMLTQGH